MDAQAEGRSKSSKRRRLILKIVVGVLALTPAAGTIFRFFTDQLGANPIAEAMNELGLWTLILLCATLACTPIKIVTGWTTVLTLQRLLGLCTFAYVSLHFLTYLVLDQFFDWGAIGQDIAKRKFITIGFLGFLLMVPLAITSTDKMVKRLGYRRWKRLHRLVYVAAIAGVVHYVWRVKADLRQPLIFAAVLLVLFAVRVIDWAKKRGRKAAAPASARAA